jgi:hypothetical protein
MLVKGGFACRNIPSKAFGEEKLAFTAFSKSESSK